jgi:hypothetical protein
MQQRSVRCAELTRSLHAYVHHDVALPGSFPSDFLKGAIFLEWLFKAFKNARFESHTEILVLTGRLN